MFSQWKMEIIATPRHSCSSLIAKGSPTSQLQREKWAYFLQSCASKK